MTGLNQRGDAFGVLIFLTVVAVLFLTFFVRFSTSNTVVSGIVYNTTNDRAISGATRFSVRAAVDTYVTEENQSSYCLPPHSPYKALVNKAAADKSIRVVVTTKKFFAVKAPWTCVSNVSVKLEKK